MNDGIDWPDYKADEPVVQQLKLLRFHEKSGKWVSRPFDQQQVAAKKLSVVTFNTWFQKHHWDLRHRALLEILEECNADIILLQEVNEQLLQQIHEHYFIRKYYQYVRAPFRVNTIPTHGLVLLSKLPFHNATLYPIPTYMKRSLLVAEFCINNLNLAIAAVHLESMNDPDTRAEQLHAIFDILKNFDHVILGGDFNFCSSDQKENGRLDSEYLDVWSNLKPDQPGFTRDTDVNTMLLHMKGKRKQARIDRILIRSQSLIHWQGSSIALLGTSVVASKHTKIYPSDHFGLFAKFKFVTLR